MTDKIFCVKPFNSIFLGPDGGIRPCCSLQGDLGNLNEQTIEEILNGPISTSIRESFTRYEWPKECSLCERLKLIGPGLGELKYDDVEHEKIMSVGAEYFKLRSMDLRWTNLCNLACNYCMPYFSSRWAQVEGKKINFLQKDNVQSLMKYIELNIDDISDIMMLGGEPLLQKENVQLLDIIAGRDIGVNILTNLTNPLNENAIANKLFARNRVDWNISMETVGDRFEYVRDGGSWEVLNDNIRILNENRPNVNRVVIFPLYCTYSAFNLVELFEWAISMNIDDIIWQVIDGFPNALAVKNLSEELRLEAIDEIDKVVSLYSNRR